MANVFSKFYNAAREWNRLVFQIKLVWPQQSLQQSWPPQCRPKSLMKRRLQKARVLRWLAKSHTKSQTRRKQANKASKARYRTGELVIGSPLPEMQTVFQLQTFFSSVGYKCSDVFWFESLGALHLTATVWPWGLLHRTHPHQLFHHHHNPTIWRAPWESNQTHQLNSYWDGSFQSHSATLCQPTQRAAKPVKSLQIATSSDLLSKTLEKISYRIKQHCFQSKEEKSL